MPLPVDREIPIIQDRGNQLLIVVAMSTAKGCPRSSRGTVHVHRGYEAADYQYKIYQLLEALS